MNHKDYNGWTNYETWNVKLWIDNDQGSQEYWNEQARELKDTYKLSLALESSFEEENPVGDQANMWADLMSAALSEVDWYEIAESIIDNLDNY